MGAGESAGKIVERVAVSIWASGLENLRVVSGRTRLRGIVVARAAVLGSPEGLAGALTGNHFPVATTHFERGRAAAPKVGDATGRPAVPAAARRGDLQGDVVAVNKAHVVEILVAVAIECELRQGGRLRPAGAIALEATAAVARGAGASARSVEVAASAAPEAARPARRGVNR